MNMRRLQRWPSVKLGRWFAKRPWKWTWEHSRSAQIAARKLEAQHIQEGLAEVAEEETWDEWDCEEHGHIWAMGQPHCLVCEERQPEPDPSEYFPLGEYEEVESVRWQD